MRKWHTVLIFGMILLAISCGKKKEPETQKPTESTTMTEVAEPEHIEVQHILIAFKGSINKPDVTRTKEEAQQLANEIFERAKKGEDFDKLVQEYTDDQYPGRYKMSNKGVTPAAAGEYPRTRMVPAFGNVGFKLNVGEVGIADYDPQTSPYGWHIIKRRQ